jgi:hypothetical protein
MQIIAILVTTCSQTVRYNCNAASERQHLTPAALTYTANAMVSCYEASAYVFNNMKYEQRIVIVVPSTSAA